MAFFVYLVVAVVTVFGVMLEMDVFVEPVHKIEYAKLPSASPAPEPVAQQAKSTTDARGNEPAPVTATAAKPAAAAASDRCDVTVCAAAYHSFRSADCTYQPDNGPRRLCSKGVVSDQAAAEAALNAHADARPAVSAKCNVNACERAYISFSAADCTYQPLEGPRRLCSK
jgi:BA14K-like protein